MHHHPADNSSGQSKSAHTSTAQPRQTAPETMLLTVRSLILIRIEVELAQFVEHRMAEKSPVKSERIVEGHRVAPVGAVTVAVLDDVTP